MLMLEICGTTRQWYTCRMRVPAVAGQLSAAGTAGAKQQYGGCNPQEVKVYAIRRVRAA